MTDPIKNATDPIITAEQIDRAAERVYCVESLVHPGITEVRSHTWEQIGHEAQTKYREMAREAFRAVGFRIEGDES